MSMIEALLEERRGYLVRGLKDRVAQVDAQLAALGGVAVDDAPVEEATDPNTVETAAARRGRRKDA